MKIRFIKLAKRWYLHKPDYEGSIHGLKAISGTDKVCDALNTENSDQIELEISDKEIEGCDFVADFVSTYIDPSTKQLDGARYKCRNSEHKLKICKNTKIFFEDYPNVLYIKKCN